MKIDKKNYSSLWEIPCSLGGSKSGNLPLAFFKLVKDLLINLLGMNVTGCILDVIILSEWHFIGISLNL